jgi:hypothetical protein
MNIIDRVRNGRIPSLTASGPPSPDIVANAKRQIDEAREIAYESVVNEDTPHCPQCGVVLGVDGGCECEPAELVTSSPNGASLRQARELLSAEEQERAVTWALDQDVLIRATVKVLVENSSVLVLNQENLEAEESTASGELYSASVVVISARRREEEAELDLEIVEAEVSIESERKWTRRIDHDNLSRRDHYKNSGDTRKPPLKDVRMFEIKALASQDSRLIAARRVVIEAREQRKLAEAYAEALQVKIQNIPAAAGMRNREYGQNR